MDTSSAMSGLFSCDIFQQLFWNFKKKYLQVVLHSLKLTVRTCQVAPSQVFKFSSTPMEFSGCKRVNSLLPAIPLRFTSSNLWILDNMEPPTNRIPKRGRFVFAAFLFFFVRNHEHRNFTNRKFSKDSTSTWHL